MRKYDFQSSWQKLLTPEIVAQLTRIHEYKGEQSFLMETNRDTLPRLAEIAKIQSAEASNKMAGIDLSDERLKKIVLDKTTPCTRSEQEIAGYRDVLAAIHESYAYIPLQPGMILQLHRSLYKFSGISTGGRYKNADHAITGGGSEGRRFACFRPVPAGEIADAVNLACGAYNEAVQSGADPLLVIPMFILDFLCVHPFPVGSGRMSRLLTLLLLDRCGYPVGKYISIEKIIEQSAEGYYTALQQSSAGWRENKNDYAPFVRYMLDVIAVAYREFFSRARSLSMNGRSKPDRVRELIKGTIGPITKAEIMEQCPNIGQATVQRTLIELQKSGEIIKLGGGRYTAYLWNRGNDK